MRPSVAATSGSGARSDRPHSQASIAADARPIVHTPTCVRTGRPRTDSNGSPSTQALAPRSDATGLPCVELLSRRQVDSIVSRFDDRHVAPSGTRAGGRDDERPPTHRGSPSRRSSSHTEVSPLPFGRPMSWYVLAVDGRGGDRGRRLARPLACCPEVSSASASLACPGPDSRHGCCSWRSWLVAARSDVGGASC